MDVPSTVATALADRPISGAVCLEAGAGVGKATAGLLASGATRVYAVTDDPADARTVRERAGPATDRLAVVLADLRDLPLADDSVGVVTAHGLCNVLSPAALAAVATELTRVAAPACHLVVDDYEPPPDDAAVTDLFAAENAAAHLADGRPALAFYPPALLRAAFAGHGWTVDRERTLLDPVPWTESHVEAHAGVARDAAAGLPADLRESLTAEVDRRVTDAAGSAGRMYSLAFRLPRPEAGGSAPGR
jgi:hypothetical protein